MLIATCPKCGRGNQVADAQAGGTVACAQCGAKVVVPGGAALPPTVRGPRFGFRVNRLTLILLIGGAILTVVGWQTFAMSLKAKPAAQVLTCQQLADRGYGDNAHVRVSDFQALPNYVVKYQSGNSGPWSTVWLPLASFDLCRDCEGPDGKLDVPKVESSSKLRVLLRVDHAKDDAELDAITKADTLEGLVVNDLAPLSAKESDLLSQSYPAMDMRHCWVLQQGRTVENVKSTGLAMLGGGALMVLIGLWVTFKP